MTIEEKRNAIRKYCDGINFCGKCPLYPVASDNCSMCFSTYEEEVINRNYAVLFGEEETNAISNETNNPVNPNHYKQGDIECIEAIKAATVNKIGIEAVCTANVIKYLWRYEDKNGLEDVKKAKWYVERLIKELEEKQNNS